MRKAKVAAIIIGGVSTCIFGGLFGVYATSPVVSSVAPNRNVENIYEVNSEELANIAAVTSIRTTAVTTTSRKFTTTTTTAVTTTTEVINNSEETIYTASVEEAPTEPVYVYDPPMEAPPADFVYDEPATYPSTEAPTEAPTEYTESEPATDAPSEAPTEPAEEVVQPSVTPALPITDEEFIILCNAVAHEAGCYWIDEYEKAKVVEVIMNRVYSPKFPNTIVGVLTQPYQFSGSQSYVYLGTYSGYVTESVKNAVTLYFTQPESFSHGYTGFYGDGYRNYFY